jgi:hypothetical protein
VSERIGDGLELVEGRLVGESRCHGVRRAVEPRDGKYVAEGIVRALNSFELDPWIERFHRRDEFMKSIHVSVKR